MELVLFLAEIKQGFLIIGCSVYPRLETYRSFLKPLSFKRVQGNFLLIENSTHEEMNHSFEKCHYNDVHLRKIKTVF